MVGLLDIAPAVTEVTIRGTAVPVPGVSTEGIVHLLTTFPELKKMIAKRGDVDAQRIVSAGGRLAGAVIACGIGYPGDRDQEEAAVRLNVGEQIELVEAIFKVTFPNGLAPFVARLTALGVLVGDRSATAPATKSPKR